jgi:glucan phosphoethanolaminetransferase (alkaline phosphatase superfamily)
MSYVTKKNLNLRIQQLIILILHLILLKWIWHTLNNAGLMNTTEVLIHFSGIAIMGALLIFGCAKWARRRYVKGLDD